MIPIAGLPIGIIVGAIQFWMLLIFVRGVSGDGIPPRSMVCGIVQFFIPLTALLGCAFIYKGGLIWMGSGIVATLFTGTAVTFIRSRMKRET